MANEKRLIDALDTVTKISGRVTPLIHTGASSVQVYNEVLQVLSEAPTVDAVEVVHGWWKKGKYPGEYTCEHCGFEYCEAAPEIEPFKYCPECGSKNEQ